MRNSYSQALISPEKAFELCQVDLTGRTIFADGIAEVESTSGPKLHGQSQEMATAKGVAMVGDEDNGGLMAAVEAALEEQEREDGLTKSAASISIEANTGPVVFFGPDAVSRDEYKFTL